MRLVPRFSLRFLLIALTIFLIVFGIGVNYYQRFQTHEAIAQKLQTIGYEVEETTSELLGYPISKTLVGIECPLPPSTPGYLAALRELPRPHELLRFANMNAIRNQGELDSLLGAIEQFTNLEELYLADLIFTEVEFARLGSLTKLRVLTLYSCNIPPGGFQVLARMPRLEKLTLYGAKFRPADLLAQPLPALRLLNVMNTPVKELPLTKSGWGRSPNLETIIVGNSSLSKVPCEVGALPKLRQLDLASQGTAAIEWPALPAAAPQLETLALHVSQLTPESSAALQKLSQLRFLYLNQDSLRDVPRDQVVTVLVNQPQLVPNYNSAGGQEDDVVIPVAKKELAQAVIKAHAQLLFCHNYTTFLTLVMPAAAGNGTTHPWVSANWRAPIVAPVADPFAPAPPYSGIPAPYPSDPFGTPAASDPFGSPAPANPLFEDPAVPPASDPFGSPNSTPAPAVDPFGSPNNSPETTADPFGASEKPSTEK